MSTLLLRLAGPMQAWGVGSEFRVRETGREPSKSGVIGLICAALGWPRTISEDKLAELTALRMGVRVDSEGILRRDFHTAGGTHRRGDPYGIAKADGKGRTTSISERYYLADASFLVGLEGDQTLLERIDRALAEPRWQLFLGRKSFLPSCPIRLPDTTRFGPGLKPGDRETELTRYPWDANPMCPVRTSLPRRRLVLDAEYGEEVEVRHDAPVSFEAREFAPRYVRTVWAQRPED